MCVRACVSCVRVCRSWVTAHICVFVVNVCVYGMPVCACVVHKLDGYLLNIKIIFFCCPQNLATLLPQPYWLSQLYVLWITGIRCLKGTMF